MNWQGMFSNKKRRQWAILGVIWAVIIAYNAARYVKGPSSEAPVEPTSSGLKVRLDLLEKKKGGYGGIKKDIFSPLKAATPVVKPAEVKIEPPPPPPTALQVFTASVRALGFVEKEKDKTVFLSKNDELFVAKSGDLVDGRFRVLSITETGLTVRDEVTKEESLIAIAVQ